ncbi:MAG: hypothetical protein ICV84_07775 [Flavisolibacter sp.]|nr:hypothetical protein [Flavisolibacter sp.]
MPVEKTLRTCTKGHRFYKSSRCPTCPVCEQDRKSQNGFLSLLNAPARRALEAKGIRTLKQLSGFSESEIVSLHGIGPSSMPVLRKSLAEKGFTFKNSK